MSLDVELVERAEDFAGLAGQWNAALAGSARGSLFLTHQWLSAAWSFVGRERELFVLLLRDGARLAGALPLSRETQYWRRLPVRRLGLLTDPITACVRSDCFVAGDPAAAARAFGDFLRRRCGLWEVAELDSLAADGCLAAHYADFAAALGGDPSAPLPHWQLQRVAVSGSWDDYVGRLAARSRERLRRECSRIERAGRVDIEFATTPAAVAAALQGFLDLERRCGKHGRANYTPLDGPLVDYYQRQFDGLAAAGLALVATLRVDGELAGSIVAGRYGGTLTTLNDMFDPRFADLHPGHYLRGRLVRHWWENGGGCIDFNGHGQHFERWLSTGLTCHRALLYSPSAYARLLRFGHERLLPALRERLPGILGKPRQPEAPGNRGLTPEQH